MFNPSLRFKNCAASLMIISLSTFCLKSGAASLSQTKCWNIKANSNYAGGFNSTLAPDAFRMDLDKFGLIFIAVGPKWDAVVFSPQNKKYVDYPYSTWKEKFRSGLLGHASASEEVKSKKTGKTATMAGQHAEEFLVDVPRRVDRNPLRDEIANRPAQPRNMPEKKSAVGNESHKAMQEKSNGTQGEYIDLWVAKDIVPPAQFTTLMKTLLRIPADKGLPLKVVHNHKDGRKLVLYETYKIESSPMDKAAFVMPKGFKKVDDELQLLVDDSEMDYAPGEPATKGKNDKPADAKAAPAKSK